MEMKFNVTGMTCSACSARVDRAVRGLEGVSEVNVNLLQNRMTVEFDDGILGEAEIIGAVVKAGYGASVFGKKAGVAAAAEGVDESVIVKRRLIISICFLVPLMYVGMGGMMGLPVPMIFEMNPLILGLTELFLTVPVMYVNDKFYKVGFKTLFKLSPNMDSLIAIGSGAAFLYSSVTLFRMALDPMDMSLMHELYFESAAMILTLITVGKYLESRSKKKTSDAITKLMNLAPKTAIVIREGKEVTIPSENVVVGDIVVVKTGSAIPVDGVIIEGAGSIDESAITGESLPAEKKAGDNVTGATVNKSGYFKFKATKIGDDTALSQIIRLVEDAAGSKAPIAKLADKVAGVFVPIVIGIAVVTTIVWLLLGYSVGFSLGLGIAVLVISCPCSLGLATPTAIMVGTGKGAELGILIKSAESLETAHSIDTVVLDKTGTITTGSPQVTDVFPVGISSDELLKKAASVEALSEHPLGKAICEEYDGTLYETYDFVQIAGEGVKAKIGGKAVFGGNSKMMANEGIDVSVLHKQAEEAADEGKTPLYFAEEGKCLGAVFIADAIKASSPQAVKELQKEGIEVIMLTGDNKKTAAAIAKKAGITNVISEVLPEDKEAEVRKLQQQGRKVAMTGDGINDAPALTRADIGVAIGAGTDIAIESADVVLMKSDLLDVPAAIRLSKAVMKNIKENLFWAFFYNVIGIPAAAGVLYIPFGIKLNPMIGAAAMSLSSVFVVSNALRLRFFKTGYEKNKPESKNNKDNIQTVDKTTKTIKIKGMMCEHCTGAVSKALNSIDGVHADVSLENKNAVVTLTKDVSDDILKAAVTDSGYKVISIK